MYTRCTPFLIFTNWCKNQSRTIFWAILSLITYFHLPLSVCPSIRCPAHFIPLKAPYVLCLHWNILSDLIYKIGKIQYYFPRKQRTFSFYHTFFNCLYTDVEINLIVFGPFYIIFRLSTKVGEYVYKLNNTPIYTFL